MPLDILSPNNGNNNPFYGASRAVVGRLSAAALSKLSDREECKKVTPAGRMNMQESGEAK